MIELPGIYQALLYSMAFVTLYMAIFWLLVITREEEDISKKPKEITEYPSVSVLIPAYNEGKSIKKTITSVLKSNYPKDKLEVLILPNGCTDNTEEVARNFESKRVKVYPLENPNKGEALNYGIEKAQGELVAVMDADSYIHEDGIKKLIPKLEREDVAAVIPMIEIHKPQKFVQKIQWCEYLVAQFMKKLMSVLGALYITPGVLSIYKKEILKEVGGFDKESLTEDAEIATRLQYYGYDVEAEINSIGYTNGPSTWKSLHKQRLRWRRGIINIIFKYKEMWFNKEYGYLGSFVMPITILVAILSTSLFIFMFAGIYLMRGHYANMIDTLITSIMNMGSVDLSLSSLKTFLLSRNSMIYYLLFSMMGLGLLIFLKVRSILKERKIYIIPLIVFLTYYQLFLTAHWLIAGFYELFNFKKEW